MLEKGENWIREQDHSLRTKTKKQEDKKVIRISNLLNLEQNWFYNVCFLLHKDR